MSFVDYRVVSAPEIHTIESVVRSLMLEGWVLHGSLQVSPRNYVQALALPAPMAAEPEPEPEPESEAAPAAAIAEPVTEFAPSGNVEE